MLWLPVAQAVTTQRFGPFSPKRIATLAAAMFGMMIGSVSG